MSSIEDQTGLKSVPKYIDCIDFNNEGHIALATSNLTGNYWNGALITFNNADYAPNFPHIEYVGMNLAGCINVEWMDTDTLVAATDAGTVEIWKLKDPPNMENSVCYAEHDDLCTNISVSNISKQILSCSWDSTIKLWDLEADLSINSFHLHIDHVLDVKWAPSSADLFCSVSRDGNVFSYDNRVNEKPATVLDYTNFTHPTCLIWLNETKLCIGYDDGSLSFIDQRNTKEKLNCFKPHKKTINSVTYNAEKNVAITASDDMRVLSVSMNGDINSIAKHTDYVRSVKVYKQFIYSSGWDGQILKSDLTNAVNKMEV